MTVLYCEADSKPSGWSSGWTYLGNDKYVPVVFGYNYIINNRMVYGIKDGVATVVIQPQSQRGSITIPTTITYKGTTCSVTSIGSSAFRNCSSLTSIEIPSSVTSIGAFAFYDCSSVTSVTFGDNSQLASIGSSAFYNCNSLTSIEIPSGVTSIGSSGFSGCSSLTSVTFGENSQLTSIGEDAFYNCSSMTSIEIPSGVTSIGSSAFYNCSSMTIYCEASRLPSGWDSDWNSSNRPVVWDYKNK